MPAQWFMAWVDPTETTFSASHQVMDEDIFSIQIDGREGEVAICTLVLKNPRIGLLNAGRRLWIWLSWSDGTNTFPVFFGRLVGIPENVFGNLVTLIFLAKPLDFDDQRTAISQGFKSLPVFDPVFVDSRLWDDPDAIVDTLSVRWQCTRGEDGAPLTVSVSDILEGEDGVEVFEEDETSKDGINLTISSAPLDQITVKASVFWDQTGSPGTELALRLPLQLVGFNEALYTDWPKPGASLGGGWAAGPSTRAIDLAATNNLHTSTLNVTFYNKEKEHQNGDVMSSSHTRTAPVDTGCVGFSQILRQTAISGVVWPGGGYGTETTNWHTVFDGEGDNDDPDINVPYHYDSTSVYVGLWRIAPSLTITAEGGLIKRKESVIFTMTSDLQAILTLPDPAPTNTKNPIEQSGCDVGAPIVGEGGTIAEAAPPIGDTTLAHYFPTTRGILSLENRLLWARAQLRQGARVVSATWPVQFERALFLTCRKSAQLNWRNMPGGQVRGKIISYQIFHNVNTGHRGGVVTVGATPGHEGVTTITTVSGNSYFEAGYIQDGYFVNTAAITAPDPNQADFGYSVPVAETSTGSFPLAYDDVVKSITVTGSVQDQLARLNAKYPSFTIFPIWLTPEEQQLFIDQAEIASRLTIEGTETVLNVELVPITGTGFENQYQISVTPLNLPRTIDFEAASNA